MIFSSTSGVRYVEHGNLNSYRNYPFSETAVLRDTNGVSIPSDVFTDAVLHPVVDDALPMRLSLVDHAAGSVEISYGAHSMSGYEDQDTGAVELFDELGRHAGSLVCGPGWGREKASMRRMEFEEAWFSSLVCCPVVHTGVVSISDENRTWRTTRRDIVFEGDGFITPVLTETEIGPELRFDAQYTPPPSGKRLVNQVVVAVIGDTLFSAAALGGGNVELAMPPLDREDICWQAHKEDAVATVADACAGDGEEECEVPEIQSKFEEFEVCPSDSGDVSLFSDDAINYKNPIKVESVQGSSSNPRSNIVSGMSFEEIVSEGSKSLGAQIMSGNGIRISIPGVGNA